MGDVGSSPWVRLLDLGFFTTECQSCDRFGDNRSRSASTPGEVQWNTERYQRQSVHYDYRRDFRAVLQAKLWRPPVAGDAKHPAGQERALHGNARVDQARRLGDRSI